MWKAKYKMFIQYSNKFLCVDWNNKYLSLVHHTKTTAPEVCRLMCTVLIRVLYANICLHKYLHYDIGMCEFSPLRHHMCIYNFQKIYFYFSCYTCLVLIQLSWTFVFISTNVFEYTRHVYPLFPELTPINLNLKIRIMYISEYL